MESERVGGVRRGIGSALCPYDPGMGGPYPTLSVTFWPSFQDYERDGAGSAIHVVFLKKLFKIYIKIERMYPIYFLNLANLWKDHSTAHEEEYQMWKLQDNLNYELKW